MEEQHDDDKKQNTYELLNKNRMFLKAKTRKKRKRICKKHNKIHIIMVDF